MPWNTMKCIANIGRFIALQSTVGHVIGWGASLKWSDMSKREDVYR